VPGWERDLDEDLERLRDSFGVDLLVSLLEDHELALLGISRLYERCAEMGIAVVRFPIPDFGVPRSLEALRALVEGILGAARDGRTVIVHCRGGLGRSGLVASAALTARGIAAEEAVTIVRSVRPNALENPEQEEAVRAFARLCDSSPSART